MIDKELITTLDDKKIIDKRYVLWWQLDFEGRRIFTEEEFNQGLKSYIKRVWRPHTKKVKLEKFRFWTKDEVPILIKNIDLCGFDVNCFISIKPASHWPKFNIESEKNNELPPSIYEQPHVRGVVIEVTDKFLFWSPLLFGMKPEYYSSYGKFLEKENMWCLICPINPNKFYKNLIYEWRGQGSRAQKKAKGFNYSGCGFEVVPYFDFDPSKRQVMVYPTNLNDRVLDTPIVIKSITEKKRPEILGAGYPNFDSKWVSYWTLNHEEERRSKNTLIERFGYIK